MNQDEINERERNNPDNWGKLLAFYSSDSDSRFLVRQRRPRIGWTLNLAHPIGKILTLFLVLVPCLLVAVGLFAALHR